MIYTIVVIIVLILSYILLGLYFFYYSTNPKVSAKKLFKGNHLTLASDASFEWFENVKKYDIYVNSFDNLKLHAYKIPNKSHKWIILIHGYTNTSNDMLDYAKHFYDNGYNILIIDQRAHGKSEGKYSTMSWNERLDVLKWIKFIVKEDKQSKIALLGLSMGASTTVLTCGENLSGNVVCAISDCGFYSIYHQFYYQLKHGGHIPEIVISAANIFYTLLGKFNIYKADGLEKLKSGKIPILFIHGGSDKFVSINDLDVMYKNYPGKKEKLIIDGAKHMKSMNVDPNTYFSKVDSFTKKYIK